MEPQQAAEGWRRQCPAFWQWIQILAPLHENDCQEVLRQKDRHGRNGGAGNGGVRKSSCAIHLADSSPKECP